jgi:hypothetical protein
MEMLTLRRRKTHSGHASHVETSAQTTSLSATHSSRSADATLAAPYNLAAPPPGLPDDYDKTDFKVYNVLNTGLTGNLCLSLADSNGDIPTYFVINSAITIRKPDIVLRSGRDKTGPVLGVGRLPLCSPNPIGVGDPDAVGTQMLWEELRRVSTWTHARYHFEWGWGDGERRKYEWRRTKMHWFNDQDDLALVERGRDDIVLARYECNGLIRWKRRGLLSIRIADGVGRAERERWEMTVILTGMSLIELARKRTRAWKTRSGFCY